MPFARAEAFLQDALLLAGQVQQVRRAIAKGPLQGVLLADLTKAFEKVGIAWILLCFVQRAPVLAWQHLLRNILTSRKIRFRLGRTRGGLIHLQCGVDMGNGLSPWLFCLALSTGPSTPGPGCFHLRRGERIHG